jgi:hypothetical protein
LFLVYERSGRRDTLIPITSAEAASKAAVKLKTKNQVCHREAAKSDHLKKQKTKADTAKPPKSNPFVQWPRRANASFN